MRLLTLIAVATFSIASSGTASAQSDGMDGGDQLDGAFFGPEAGLVEHHFYIREQNPTTGEESGRYYRSWDVGAGLFGGYDVAVGGGWLIGAEASVVFGGSAPEARFADGSFYRAEPQFGWKVNGRLGRRLGQRTMVYGTLGYGGHDYDYVSFGVDNSSTSEHSFTIGAGVEHRLSPRLGVRLDFRHLDNQMSQLLIGLPVRF